VNGIIVVVSLNKNYGYLTVRKERSKLAHHFGMLLGRGRIISNVVAAKADKIYFLSSV
jgi:hypothetical protein